MDEDQLGEERIAALDRIETVDPRELSAAGARRRRETGKDSDGHAEQASSKQTHIKPPIARQKMKSGCEDAIGTAIEMQREMSIRPAFTPLEARGPSKPSFPDRQSQLEARDGLLERQSIGQTDLGVAAVTCSAES